MSYFGFLVLFLIPPIALLGAGLWKVRRLHHPLPTNWSRYPAWAAIALLAGIALCYTTPWDNYLVASGVWVYARHLVSGIVIGWVPLEEYLFFLLQPVLTGLCLLLMAHVMPTDAEYASSDKKIPVAVVSGLGFLILCWAIACWILVTGWQPGYYLALQWIWALPPIALQIYIGKDLLWQARRPLALTILAMTTYLSVADAIAIQCGVWSINPQMSLSVLIGGILPLEEALFFLQTNVLLVCGIYLFLNPITHERLGTLWRRQEWVLLKRSGS